MPLRIILVEPREAGNVGAAARVMKNFGFSQLTIVGEHPELHPLAGWWASGADDVIEKATFAADLRSAVGGAQRTVATTSTRGRSELPALEPSELAEMLRGLGDDQTLALVFGREDRGLTMEEIALCQYSAAIPTNPESPVMNLAQAVGAFCFALSQIKRSPRERTLPSAEKIERMHDRARALLLEAGFLHENNPDRIYDELRAIVARADLDDREATIFLGIVRQFEWKLGKTNE